jgi:hypothetical protein
MAFGNGIAVGAWEDFLLFTGDLERENRFDIVA